MSNETNEGDDLNELLLDQNINVWSKNQETLEEQALQELQTFTEELYKEDKECDNTPEAKSLDINAYIKRQEELKKRQDFKKSLVEKQSFSVKKAKRKLVSDDKIDKCSDVASGSEYEPSDCDYDSSSSLQDSYKVQKKRKRQTEHYGKVIDDSLNETYQSRLDLYYKEYQKNSAQEEDHVLKSGLKIPISLWNKLYTYQQDGIKWLYRLHKNSTGGILGDEMGLGKTVQTIVFLYALHYNRVSSCHGRFKGLGPTIIACPATVLQQWVKHFHEWAPEFRVAVLHQSGTYQGNKSHLIKDIHKSKGILLTTYAGITKHQPILIDHNWHYIILDEGHKIRNPSIKTTIACKSFKTPHKILLTGSPMQNDLTELWSLFDFTNPGMLGNLKTFQEHFSTPILQGGFTNSTVIQEATALSVATVLKDLITPYLLRRTKNEVQDMINLPNKTEQVLFCSLSEQQKDLYKEYLLGDDVSSILKKGVKNWSKDDNIKARVFVAINKLRKICNHPDIYLEDEADKSYDYKSSGKMIVVSALLKIWKKQGHRVLLFTQSRLMIDIFEVFLEKNGYKFIKMDGSTSINTRQFIIDKFNKDASYDVFLLTTRVGGLGVNLTGANRVIIYDPDWNPAIDTQARERAWRIGQSKQVTIYRLLSAGTIEEKMYQRQIWKQLLSNKILSDPKTSKFFKSSDLYDLFALNENPETVNIFRESRVKIQEKLKKSNKFSEEKIQEMKNKAKEISKSLSNNNNNNNNKESLIELEFKDEMERRRNELEEMKTLEVSELRKYNKEKLIDNNESEVNKIDDCEAKVGFTEALDYTTQTAKLHKKLTPNLPPNQLTEIIDELNRAKETITKKPDKLIDKYKKRSKIDLSGKIDGVRIENLVKREVKKLKNEQSEQDDYILGKLFQKKGVSGAVQHESVIQEGSRGGSGLRAHVEAKIRAEKSLEALKKSRIDNWRW